MMGQISVVPEPATAALLIGLFLITYSEAGLSGAESTYQLRLFEAALPKIISVTSSSYFRSSLDPS